MLQDIVIGQAPNKMYSAHYPVKDKDGITPQTRAIFFCMLATGVQKLFTYEDCHEFVFRLALMFRQLDVIDNFFKNVMKDMPRKPFDQFYEEERETLQKMEEYLNFIKSPLPIRYDWDSLPEENQQAILKHLVEEDFYREGMTMEDAIEEYAEWIPDLVYLAWINANGLAGDLYFSEIDPRVDFDLSRYSELGVDDGINLGVTYDTFDLYTIEEYLVDPLNKNKKVS